LNREIAGRRAKSAKGEKKNGAGDRTGLKSIMRRIRGGRKTVTGQRKENTKVWKFSKSSALAEKNKRTAAQRVITV